MDTTKMRKNSRLGNFLFTRRKVKTCIYRLQTLILSSYTALIVTFCFKTFLAKIKIKRINMRKLRIFTTFTGY